MNSMKYVLHGKYNELHGKDEVLNGIHEVLHRKDDYFMDKMK